jgi:hypothetical protein
MQIFAPLEFWLFVCSVPWANPLQKFSRAKLLLLLGVTVQASARSPAVLILILTGAALGALVGAAACVDKVQTTAMSGGVEALKASVAPGPAPVKSEAALRVVMPLLEEPVADRRNWTIPRLRAAIEAREGVRISRSQLSKALRKKVPLAATATHAEGTPDRRGGRTGRPAFAIAQTTG